MIALASVTDAEIDGETEVPDALYRFFAEEIFEALGDDVRGVSPSSRSRLSSTANSRDAA